ncbi:MAG: hypothetical protein QOE90_1524 [Thermoplasmata archaeon]|jgi:hypothetical protein|nr:hypothetical protein [Thermoplasmata archaeon]
MPNATLINVTQQRAALAAQRIAAAHHAANATAPIAASHASTWPWGWTILGGLAIFVLARLVLSSARRARRGLPTRIELERDDAKPAAKAGLLVVALLVAYAVLWWTQNGSALVATWTRRLNFFLAWWNLVLKPQDRTLILAGAFVLGIGAGFALWLLRRLYYRSVFPDLLRLDPEDHPGSRPERLGRLYYKRAFVDHVTADAPALSREVATGPPPSARRTTRRIRIEWQRFWRLTYPRPRIETREAELPAARAATHVRLYYKAYGRLFPLLRMDTLDVPLPQAPRAYALGQVVLRVKRIEREPDGPRFRRRIAPGSGAYDAQPVVDTFRLREVEEDTVRKIGIVLPGSAMNPEVARKKFAHERQITSWDHETDLNMPMPPGMKERVLRQLDQEAGGETNGSA